MVCSHCSCSFRDDGAGFEGFVHLFGRSLVSLRLTAMMFETHPSRFVPVRPVAVPSSVVVDDRPSKLRV